MKFTNIVKNSVFFIPAFFIMAIVSTAYAHPYSVELLPDKTIYDDFVVGPGKYEVSLNPGESRVINIILSNRLGSPKTFEIQTEDFTGSRDLEKTVVLLENERGPYSLRDYLSVASTTFTIGHAERVTIPVTVNIPTDAEPGGLYGSVVIGTVTSPQEQGLSGNNSMGASPIVTRIGSLLFIRVAGDIDQDLTIREFSLKNDKKIVGELPVNFEILYENNGNVHENPYGQMVIKNMFGSEVANIEIEPWFVLPESLRVREISWNPNIAFGRYTADLNLERVYDDKADRASVVFWVIPWKIILVVFIAFVVIIYIVRWLFSKVQISIKK